MPSPTYNTANKFENFAMTMPFENGSISVPQQITFGTERTEIDLSQLVYNNWLDWVSGVYIDNTANAGYLLFECFGTNQKFYFPPNSSGYVPLFLPNPPKVYVTHSSGGAVQFQWYNVPVFPLVLRGPSASFEPVQLTGPNISDYTLTLDGTSQTLCTVGQAAHYFLIQNPVGNNNVTVNLAGGDSAVSGIVLSGGQSYEATAGIANAITIKGTNTQHVNCFAG